jgi:hypothetical protein
MASSFFSPIAFTDHLRKAIHNVIGRAAAASLSPSPFLPGATISHSPAGAFFPIVNRQP